MGFSKMKYPGHDDQHFLLWKSPKEPYTCRGCKERDFGPCYECEHEDCDFHLHEECANAAPYSSNSFSKSCNLKFHSKSPLKGERSCDACGKDVLGFVYQCSNKFDSHDYHPCCLKLQRTLQAEDGMTLYLKEKLPSKCLSCGSKNISKKINGWGYVSSCGQYRYHVACVKDMVLNKWKKDYFLQDGSLNETNYLSLEKFAPSKEVSVLTNKGTSSGKVKQILSKAKTVIMLIVSALFGDPTTLLSSLVQQLLSN